MVLEIFPEKSQKKVELASKGGHTPPQNDCERSEGEARLDRMKRALFILSIAVIAVLVTVWSGQLNGQKEGVQDKSSGSGEVLKKEMSDPNEGDDVTTEVATIGGGCFWCTEAVLEGIDGVLDVQSGYMGGHVDNPTYEQVCAKTTGHAEVIQVKFDPVKVSFEDVMDIFWQAHDPTTLNQQGADRGPQYRSVVFYHSPEQKNLAVLSKKALDSSGAYDDPAVTEITEASVFWPAEEYHQDYYRQNKDKNPYCRIVITPKMKKLGLE
tara:strand:+ start:356 stop:1156 length:801 start_codon:yes stop_codon:yes gene_type:complete